MENKAIYSNMVAIMKSVSPITKDKVNLDQKYQFRGIDDMYNTLHKLFADNDVFIVPSVLNIEREERRSKSGSLLLWTVVTVKYRFVTDDGSFIEAETKGEAMDTSDKGCNKAISAALKYALIQMFLIPTKELTDNDADNVTNEVKSKEQEYIEEAVRLIDLAKTTEDLKEIKESYPSLFKSNKEVKSAATNKFNQIKSTENGDK